MIVTVLLDILYRVEYSSTKLNFLFISVDLMTPGS